MTTYELAKHLMVLKDVYSSVGKTKHKRDIAHISKMVDQLTSMVDQPLDSLLKRANVEAMTTKAELKKNSFERSLEYLLNKQYDQLKGTKVKYADLHTCEEVTAFFNNHTDTAILKKTTMLDLKLLYSLLTDEKNELKGKKKDDLVKKIRLNIRAGHRGEAFLNM
ncbi:hypothetical protein [Metabacillus iocasae]|uniref:Uncharacterized protein n=1 Tax=Priestia iocasae TaxID=2291674 RepID=A0ABS2QVK1_9BACI|nr:hypothetical protein [Metabacillus iocasae]MBM7703513.1 hypothetical protein [Metabacillus iocasae]